MGIPKPTKIKLGQKVRDTITGLEGIAISRTEWLYGCVRVTVQAEGGKDGLPYDPFVVDEPQLEVVKKKAAPKSPARAGPRRDPGRAAVERSLTADQEDGGDGIYRVPERRA